MLTILDSFLGQPGATSGIDLVTGVTVRLVVFAVMTYVILQMSRGRNWARATLAVVLGVLETLSLVIGPVQWLLEGHAVTEALAGASVTILLFMASGVVHVGAVLSGLILMFRLAANAYFRRS